MSINCRCRSVHVFICLVTLTMSLVFMLSQFTFKSYKARLILGSLLQRNLDKLPRRFGAVNINLWLSKNVLKLDWEKIHCSEEINETKNIIFSQWVAKLSKVLGVVDGQSLFDTNTRCLEWLKQFRSQFPNLDLAGFDQDYDAVDYAKRFFHDTAPKFVKRLLRAGNESFDHAINFAGLQAMRADKQCSTVKAILKTLKPGGILYIGHNLEQICQTRKQDCKKCLADNQRIGFTILNKCFWPKMCFRGERNLYEIYYILEQKFFGSVKDFSECQTGVFIRKKENTRGNTKKTQLPALETSDIYFKC